MANDITTLPTFDNPWLDLTTDETHILLGGNLENGSALRIPMSIETGMRVLALLERLREHKGYDMPLLPVEIDRLQ